MGLGDTARKVQGLADTAEELYAKLTEVLERVRAIETSIEDSSERLTDIEARLDRQAAILEAIAAAEGVDVPAPIEAADADAAMEEGDADTATGEDDADAAAGEGDAEAATGEGDDGAA